MRVLFTAHQFFPEHQAGTEVLTLGLAKSMKASGHEPYVLAAMESRPHADISPYETRDYEHEGIPVRRVGRPASGFRKPYALEYDDPRMAGIAADFVRDIRPDVLHAMHLQGLSAAVVPAVAALGVPVVYTATDFWAVCPVVDLLRHDGVTCRGPDPSHCPKCIFSRSRSTKLARVVGSTPGIALRTATKLAKSAPSGIGDGFPLELLRSLDARPGRIRELLSGVSRMIAPTGLTRELLLENGVGEGVVSVSGYGVDTSGLRRDTPEPSSSPLRVGYIGTLVRHKGCDVLARAFRSLPSDVDATLDIYGNRGQYAGYVRELEGITAGDDRIAFRDTFPPREMGRILAGMDVLVVPSRWYENTPLVVFSALASGTPVVATDLGGLSEVVGDGRNGLLFPVDDPAGLARCLGRLAVDREFLRELARGIGPVKTIEENAAEMLELYEDVIRAPGGRSD